MKTMIVYYSHDGNTKFAVEMIAAHLGADILTLEPEKPLPTGKFSKYFWGGKSVVFNEKPALKPYQFDASKYDAVILGSPVWAGSFAPPMATFLQDNSLADVKIGLLACHGGGGTDKCFRKLEAALPASPIVARLGLKNPLDEPKSASLQTSIEVFCNPFTA